MRKTSSCGRTYVCNLQLNKKKSRGMDRDQGMSSFSACQGNKKPRDAMQSAPWQGFEPAGYQNAAKLHAVYGCTHITESIRLTHGCHVSTLLSVETSMSLVGNIHDQLYGTVLDCQVGDFSLLSLQDRVIASRLVQELQEELHGARVKVSSRLGANVLNHFGLRQAPSVRTVGA